MEGVGCGVKGVVWGEGCPAHHRARHRPRRIRYRACSKRSGLYLSICLSIYLSVYLHPSTYLYYVYMYVYMNVMIDFEKFRETLVRGCVPSRLFPEARVEVDGFYLKATARILPEGHG